MYYFFNYRYTHFNKLITTTIAHCTHSYAVFTIKITLLLKRKIVFLIEFIGIEMKSNKLHLT